MLAAGTLQMDFFDNELAEIFVPAAADGTIPAERYILRRNPVREAEIATPCSCWVWSAAPR